MSLPSRKKRKKSGKFGSNWLFFLPGVLMLLSLWTYNFLALLTVGGITLFFLLIGRRANLSKIRQLIYFSFFTVAWFALILSAMS